MEKIKRAVAYCRFSSDNQRVESIDAQVRAIKNYCDKNNYTLINIYKDEAMTGTNDQREGFLEMIEASKNNQFDLVIVHKLDRFARNKYDSVVYKKKLKDNNVQVQSVIENLDGSPESVIMESVLEGMNEYYSLNLAREVRKGMSENAFNCTHNGGIPALGYDIINKKYVINKEEAEIIRKIFDLYIEGYGYALIVETLNKLGLRTKAGRYFSKTSIHDILKNEKYNGVYVWNKRPSRNNGRNSHGNKPKEEIIKIKDGVPRIVSEKKWNKAQEMMLVKIKPRKNAKYNYLLTGKLFCGSCGRAYSGSLNTKSDGSVLPRYQCGGRRNKNGCKGKGVQAIAIEKNVLNTIKDEFLSDNGITIMAEKIKTHIDNINNENNGNQLITLRKKKSTIEAKINKLLDLFLENKINQELLNLKQEELAKQLTSVNSLIKDEENKKHLIFNFDYIKNTLTNLRVQLEQGNDEIKRMLIKTFLHEVLVNSDHIEITLQYDILVTRKVRNIGTGGRTRTDTS